MTHYSSGGVSVSDDRLEDMLQSVLQRRLWARLLGDTKLPNLRAKTLFRPIDSMSTLSA